MRTIIVGIFALVLIAGVRSSAPSAQTSTKPNHIVTKEEYAGWTKELTNWGRWGKDDEIGTLNLITPAKRKAAAALVKEGFSVSLAADPDTVKAVDNPQPYDHVMQGIGTDRFGVSYHGQAHTHLDSLASIAEYQSAVENLRAKMPATTFHAEWQVGHKLTIEQSIELALS